MFKFESPRSFSRILKKVALVVGNRDHPPDGVPKRTIDRTTPPPSPHTYSVRAPTLLHPRPAPSYPVLPPHTYSVRAPTLLHPRPAPSYSVPVLTSTPSAPLPYSILAPPLPTLSPSSLLLRPHPSPAPLLHHLTSPPSIPIDWHHNATKTHLQRAD